MELRINLATATLKDAEHAIFLIGAYFGMTALPVIGNTPTTPTASAVPAPVALPPLPAAPPAPAPVVVGVRPDPYMEGTPAPNPAEVFGGPQPDAADPAQVFAGNGATAPAGLPASPTAGPSAQPVAAAAVGDAGNGAYSAGIAAGTVPTVAAPAGLSPALPPVPGASAVEVDAEGLPWDLRINAAGEGGTKPKNADGKWRKKRGLNDEAYVNAVKTELRATMAAGTPAAVVPQPPVPAVAPTPPTVPPAAPSPVAPPAAPGTVAVPTTFEALMPRITAGVMASTLPQSALLEACQAYGLTAIPMLANRPDLVPTIWAYLKSLHPALV